MVAYNHLSGDVAPQNNWTPQAVAAWQWNIWFVLNVLDKRFIQSPFKIYHSFYKWAILDGYII